MYNTRSMYSVPGERVLLPLKWYLCLRCVYLDYLAHTQSVVYSREEVDSLCMFRGRLE